MRRRIILTEDGSHSIEIPELGVTYHSIHGAIQESKHVFIEAGLHKAYPSRQWDGMRIFEVGFGTGLNALLTLLELERSGIGTYYETIEPLPLTVPEIVPLNFCEQLHRNDLKLTFEKLHSCDWEQEVSITANFIFKKINADVLNFQSSGSFDLIYFDAFDPKAQPELWTKKIFDKMFAMLAVSGVLVTYSSKGEVRRVMQAAGFEVEKIAGPPGKREIVRAVKVR